MLNLIKLENRIVLDGAAVGEALDHAAEQDANIVGDEARVPDHADDTAEGVAGAAALLSDPEVSAEPLNIVLVSDGLPDYQTLADAAEPGTQVIVYDADAESAQEVIDRVTALAEETGQAVNSVTILSHGGAGYFSLGNEKITAESVAENPDAWSMLDAVMTEESHIYVYGCSVADDSIGFGQELLDSLADATGAEVFGSTDVTGKGGDWELEAGSDGAEGGPLFSPSLNAEQLSAYSGSLQESIFISADISHTSDEDGYATFGLLVYIKNTDPNVDDPTGRYDLAYKSNDSNLNGFNETDTLTTWLPADPDIVPQIPGYTAWDVVVSYVPSENYSHNPNNPAIVQTWVIDKADNNQQIGPTVDVPVTVLSKNDAPLLDSSGDMHMDTVSENTAADDLAGQTVNDVLLSVGFNPIKDVDSGDSSGIAVVAVDNTYGTWQYNTGSGWTDFGDNLSEENATVLDQNARIRFVPDKDTLNAYELQNPGAENIEVENGVTFRAWDGSDGHSSGDTNVNTVRLGARNYPRDTWAYSSDREITNSTEPGINGTYSRTENISIAINLENDPPSLNGDMVLTPLDEDPASNPGDTLSDLIAKSGSNLITDPDGPDVGIAVVGVQDLDGGTWQYSTDNGNTWNDFSNVSETNATLLDDSAKIRFVPNDDWNSGDNNQNHPSLTIRAWDQSDDRASGTTGVNVSQEVSNSDSSFSEETGTASIVVNPMNDAPVLDNTGDMKLTDIKEDTPLTSIGGDTVRQVIDSSSANNGNAITDVDQNDFTNNTNGVPNTYQGEGLAVVGVNNGNIITLADGQQTGQTNHWEYSVDGGTTWTTFDPNSVSDVSAIVLNDSAKLRFVADENWHGTADLTVRGWDLTDGKASGDTVNTTIRTGTANPPGDTTPYSIATEIITVTVTPDGDPPVVDPDPDNPDTPDPDDPDNKNAVDFEATFIEGDNPVNVVDADAEIRDVDSTHLTSLTVTIVDKHDADVLMFGNSQTQGQVAGTNITGNYNAATGVLTLTGRDTVANYQTVLRGISFENTSDNPGPLSERTLEFQTVDDTVDAQGNPVGLSSKIAQTEITVIPRTDAPVLDLDSTDNGQRDDSFPTGEQVEFKIGEGAVPLTNIGTLTDVDDTHLTTLSVAITNESGLPFDPNGINKGDVLLFSTAGTNITGSYDPATGVLTLTGQTVLKTTADGQQVRGDTIENFQQVLNTLRFNNTSENFTQEQVATRFVVFTATDAGDSTGTTTNPLDPFTTASATAIAEVTIGNVKPVIDLDPDPEPGGDGGDGPGGNPGISPDFNASFVEGCGPVHIADATDPGTMITDSDSNNLKALTVTIQDVKANDVLAFDASGTSIAGNYDAATGTLTLTGIDTLANYESVLRSITFNNTSEAPNADTREISIVATDEEDNVSEPVTSNVTIIPTNDAPVNHFPKDQIVEENSSLILNNVTVGDVDIEQGGSGSVLVTLSAGHGVLDVTVADSGAQITGDGTRNLTIEGTLAQVNAALNGLTYTPDQDFTGQDTLTIETNDQGYSGVGVINGIKSTDPDFCAQTRPGTITIDQLANIRNDAAGQAGDPNSPHALTVTDQITIRVVPPSDPDITPEVPDTPDVPFVPITRPEGEDGEPVIQGVVRLPGPVGITEGIGRRDLGEGIGPAEREIPPPFCSIEDALRVHLGCRFANTLNDDAKFGSLSWGDMTDLGWRPPYEYLDEEYDLYSRLFLRQPDDPGFNVESGVFLSDLGGLPEEQGTEVFRGGSGEDFNDMGPGEVKEAFFAGRKSLDKTWR